MPGNFDNTSPNAVTTATAEAGMDGFPSVSNTVSVTQVTGNPNELAVSITAQVPTFFSRIFGINTFSITRSSKSIYIQPVPMGSPEAYFGSFGTYQTEAGSVTLKGPNNETMTARGFWASMLTQGAAVQNGDAYLPTKNSPDSNGTPTGTNPEHSDGYYDYSIYMPPGSTNGQVYIYDPGFCDTGFDTNSNTAYGTGDRWFVPTGTHANTNAVSSYYKLYDTNNQPYNLAAQTPLGDSGSFFANIRAADTDQGSSVTTGTHTGDIQDCRNSTVGNAPTNPLYYHDRWWNMMGGVGTSVNGASGTIGTLSGGTTGRTYRLRTTTDPGDATQDNTNATNDFAIFVTDTGTAPQVSGIGAMQMYTPLAPTHDSQFYLAQLSQQAGAGKTIEIDLFDPGDTNNVPANMKVLQPTAGGWSAVNLTWTATRLATSGSNCVGGSGTSIQTNNGGTSYFNGCWVTIDIYIPTTYTAPMNGWWGIEYDMGTCVTRTGCVATDETTWQVNIEGNPVHLV